MTVLDDTPVESGGTERVPVALRRRDVRRLTWTDEQEATRRWQWAVTGPWIAAASTAVYGTCAYYVGALDGSPGATATLAGLGAAGVVFVTRIGLRTVYSARWSWRFWLSGTVAAAWSMLSAITGPSWVMAAVLASATVTFAARWWRAWRLPNPSRGAAPEAAPPVAEAESASADPAPAELLHKINRLWDIRFASPGGQFAGSVMTGAEKLKNGWRVEIHLDPERHHYDMLAADAVISSLAALLGHLGIAKRDILIEPHPSEDHSKGVVTFLTARPLAGGVPYQGPRYDKGFIAVGPWQDGEGWGSVQLADHNATVINGLVTGDPGFGKTVFLENLGMSARASGCWKVFYCDGSEDADSSSLLNDYMDGSETGISGAWKQLAAVKEYLAVRGEENNALPANIRGVNPSPQRMGLLWILDELHRLCQDKAFAEELAQVVRLGRKKGVAVWAATQGVDLRADFGGNAALRDIMTSRNVIAFYASSTYAHTMISGTTIAPNKLPADGGYAFLKAPRMDRAMMLRTDYAQDMTPWARAIPNYPWDRAGWLSVRKYLESRAGAEESRELAQRRFQERLRRLELGLPAEGEAAATDRGATKAVGGMFDDLKARMPTTLTVDDVVPLRVVHDATSEGATALDATHDAILAHIGSGVALTADIVTAAMDATGCAERTAKRKLAELLAAGLVARDEKQGRYRRAVAA